MIWSEIGKFFVYMGKEIFNKYWSFGKNNYLMNQNPQNLTMGIFLRNRGTSLHNKFS